MEESDELIAKLEKTIDGMIAQLLEKKTDEINHKDFCDDVLNINQLETEKKDRGKSVLKAKNRSRTSSSSSWRWPTRRPCRRAGATPNSP